MVDFSYVCLDKLTSPLVVRRRRRPRSFALSRRLRQRQRSTTMTTTTTTTTMMLSRRWLPLAHALTAIGCMFTRHRTVSFSHSRLSTQYSSLPETHSSYTLRGWITSSFFELSRFCFSLFGTPPTRTPSAPSIQPYEEEKQDFPALSSIHWPDTLLASFFCYFVSFSISLCLSFRSVSPTVFSFSVCSRARLLLVAWPRHSSSSLFLGPCRLFRSRAIHVRSTKHLWPVLTLTEFNFHPQIR